MEIERVYLTDVEGAGKGEGRKGEAFGQDLERKVGPEGEKKGHHREKDAPGGE